MKMLTELDGLGTGWAGQIAFSDGGGVRDPHVVYGWLDLWADQIFSAVSSIVLDPHTERATTRALSRRGGAGIDVPATLRLIRSDPSRFLEEHAAGVVAVDESRYMPQRVMLRRQRSTIDTAANRRVVRLVVQLRRLADEVYAASDVRFQQTRGLRWLNEADRVLTSDVAQRLLRFADLPLGHARSDIERTDRRYDLTYRMMDEVSNRFGWTPSPGMTSRYSYIQKSDVIYQAYCASVLARLFRMTQTDVLLGRRQPAFTGDDLDLYFDVPPPPNVLRSWRSFSVKPDSSRPDLLLHRPSTGEVALIDAKYRVDGNEASEDSRKEVSAYMALYGLDQIGIAFPGSGSVRTVTGSGRSILELPIRPPATDHDKLRAAVETLFAPPRILDP